MPPPSVVTPWVTFSELENISVSRRWTRRAFAPRSVCSDLKRVEFRQDIDEDAEVVFLEALKGGRVVQQDVGVQHVVFGELGRGREA